MRLPFFDPPREEVAAVASDLIIRFGLHARDEALFLAGLSEQCVLAGIVSSTYDSQVSKTGLSLDHMRPGYFQDQIVRFSESTPSRLSCATDGRSRRLKVSADRDGLRLDGSGIDRQEQRALPRFIAT